MTNTLRKKPPLALSREFAGVRPLTPDGWTLIRDIARYLRAVDTFRAAGSDPHYRKEEQ